MALKAKSDDRSQFAKQVRAARLKRAIRVADVADCIGVTAASVYLWESDKVRPSNEHLTALCRFLKLPIRATRLIATAR